MGHYASEMESTAKFAVVAPTRKNQWVVKHDFSIVPSRGLFYYPDVHCFNSKRAAEEAVPDLIRKRINALEAEIDMLNTILDLKSDKFCGQCGVEKNECFCGGGYR